MKVTTKLFQEVNCLVFLTELLSSNVRNKYSAAQKTYKLFAGKFAFTI